MSKRISERELERRREQSDRDAKLYREDREWVESVNRGLIAAGVQVIGRKQ